MADDKIIKIGDTKYALHPEVYELLQKLNTENSQLKEAVMDWYGQEERDISPRSALYPIAEIAKSFIPKGSVVADEEPPEEPEEVEKVEDVEPDSEPEEVEPEADPDEYDEPEEAEPQAPVRRKRPQRKK